MIKHYTTYTKEILEPIVQTSFSYAECLRKLDRKATGGNYKNLQKNIDKFNLNTDHMTHQCWNKGKEIIPFEGLKGKNHIRKRFLKDNGHSCQYCGLSEWMGGLIPLELDHIDGNNRNNERGNLRLLCPNCHALTPTYRNRLR